MIVAVTAVVAAMAWGHVPPWRVITWATAVAMVLCVRLGFALQQLRAPPVKAQRALDRMVLLALAAGVATGSAAPLFFPDLPDQSKPLLTMILVCWTAGSVSTSAYAGPFYAYVGPALLPISILWAMTGNVQNLAISALILLFSVVLVLFVRDNERVVRESFVIRFENERLLGALEQERQEVLLARDRAETANRAKSRFLAAASHDLRQPLHALSLYSAALKLRSPEGTVGEIANNINEALSSLSALVDSLLDISRLDAGAVKPEWLRVNVSELIDRIEAEFRPVARENALDFSVRSIDAEIETDPVLFVRVLRNLVDNAFKYTVAGGVSVEASLLGDAVRIAVRDTGSGIPEVERERIFEEFYQVDNSERDRRKGLGLGLAIVRRLSRLLRLDMELETTPGVGSTFVVSLARVAGAGESPQAAVAAPAVDERSLDGVSVLVIDDEAAVRVAMRTLLESWECRVATCNGLAEALQLIDNYDLRVDLIVSDLRLPQLENGIDTVRTLRRRLGGEVPALIVSGDTAPERLAEAAASGLPFLHKPLAAEALKEALLAALACQARTVLRSGKGSPT